MIFFMLEYQISKYMNDEDASRMIRQKSQGLEKKHQGQQM